MRLFLCDLVVAPGRTLLAHSGKVAVEVVLLQRRIGRQDKQAIVHHDRIAGKLPEQVRHPAAWEFTIGMMSAAAKMAAGTGPAVLNAQTGAFARLIVTEDAPFTVFHPTNETQRQRNVLLP